MVTRWAIICPYCRSDLVRLGSTRGRSHARVVVAVIVLGVAVLGWLLLGTLLPE
jgi:hypothetical protein